MPCFESSNQSIERIIRENIIMRIAKALLLLSAAMLVACSSNGSTASSTIEESSNSVESSVTTSSEVVTSETTTSATSSVTSSTSAVTSSSSVATSSTTSVATSSSEITSSTTTSTSSELPPLPVENTLTFSFLNPSCGSQGTDALNAKLKAEMNAVAGSEFVTNIGNTACQFMADAPVKDNQILTVGSSKKAGSLEITFAETIKSLTITVETYNKTYAQNGADTTNVDSNSVLYFNTDANVIDLKPVDGKAVTKEYTAAINSDSFKVYNKGSGARVFIRSLTVTY